MSLNARLVILCMPAKKLTRALQPPEDSHERLLQAAIHVFTERGYEDASIRAICKRAGLNVAMVRYHFGGKRGLYDEVIRFVVDTDARKELLRKAVQESATPEEALRQAIHTVFRRLITRTEQSHVHLRLMLNEITHPSSVLTDEMQASMQSFYDQFRRLVGSILKLPIDHLRTRLSTHSVLGQMAHYVHARPLLQRLWPEMQMSPEQIAMIADHIADFSLASLKAVQHTTGTRKKSTRKKG